MKRSWAACIPWPAILGNLTLLSEESKTDATWLLMVVASALKESDRLKHRAVIGGGGCQHASTSNARNGHTIKIFGLEFAPSVMSFCI